MVETTLANGRIAELRTDDNETVVAHIEWGPNETILGFVGDSLEVKVVEICHPHDMECLLEVVQGVSEGLREILKARQKLN